MNKLISFITAICLVLVMYCHTAPRPVNFNDIEVYTENNLKRIYEENLKHTVKIHINCVDLCGSGSGTVFRTENKDGYYVLTNAHVVLDSDGWVEKKLFVEYDDGKIIEFKVLLHGEVASYSDIAIGKLIIPEDNELDLDKRSLLITENNILKRNPKTNTRLFAFGAPVGIKSILSSGVVVKPSAVFVRGLKLSFSGYFLTAKSAPGSSGSAIYTVDGKIAGIIWGGISSADLTIAAEPGIIYKMLKQLRLL